MLNAGASSREAYDNAATNGRGNLTQTLITPKSGSGLSPITTSAIFPTSCTNAVTCNLPTSTTDGRGNTTNYAYDATTELVTSGTPPAVAGGQPQTRYSNSAYQAYYYNSAGSIAASGAPVTVLTGISACCSSASCTGTADENKTSFAYGPQSTGIVNNLLPVSWSAGSGDGALTATSAASYDMIGNLASIDGPLPGSADTTNYRYDADRKLIGVVGPDPDGSGPLRMRAQRLTYNADGLVTLSERGTVGSASDADWANFASLQQVSTAYDGNDRLVTNGQQAGGTTYSLLQYSYDGLGRLDCTAQRMNPSAFGSPPDACTLGSQGSFGPDRISRNSYDATSRLTAVASGYGTFSTVSEGQGYTPNGKLASVTDAKGNITTYAYDGFDRLQFTYFVAIR